MKMNATDIPDNILRKIQDWVKSVPLIVLGSGASVPFRIPGMWALGNFLKEEMHFEAPEDIEQFHEFKHALEEFQDLEISLSKLNLRESLLQQIISKTWEYISKYDLEAYESLLDQARSFPLADLVSFLVSPSQKKLTIVTTNYDRIAEIAASRAKCYICTGYAMSYLGHANDIHRARETKTLRGFNGQVNIWKVHGSLDWFKGPDGVVSHFPLRKNIPSNYFAQIVTPGLRKYNETHNEPYRTILAEADKEIERANFFLCIGYGFNDSHVQEKLISQIRGNKPIIVITKQLSPNAKKAIIENKCKNYILIEEGEKPLESRIISSICEEVVVDRPNLWQLQEFLKLIF
jgi:hypothetical protein